ncbi:MAG: M24 family metallopeptidase [Planctomycetota bacterium]
MKSKNVRLVAGIADKNASLFRRIGQALGDPAAYIQADARQVALVRDLEMDRVRAAGKVDEVTCPAEHAPRSGLSADRETATAQAVAQWMRSHHVDVVTVDRSLPYIFAWHLQQAEIAIQYDPQLAVLDRRQKSADEIEKLRVSQRDTETVMRKTLQRIATADVNDDGELTVDGQVLTSQSVRGWAAVEFLKLGYTMSHGAICASLPEVADCHHRGDGSLKSGVPIIVDLFPRNETTRYWGDCTRTVVHGQVSETVLAMHQAVVQAKAAATEALVVGTTGDAVHQASENVLLQHGYESKRGKPSDEPSIQHGTGHGIGLDVHEPILLDFGGGEILEYEVFTIEPGLYGRNVGGVRVEDMLVATPEGPENLNRLPEGLDWKP